MLLTKYQLNEDYSLHVCYCNDDNAMNGRDFDAQKEWVIEEKSSIISSSGFQYTTKSAQKFNLPFKCDNPKIAIQQLLAYAYTGKANKTCDMWFKVVKTINL